MKLCERVRDSRTRNEVTIAEQQFGFTPGRSTTDAIFLFKDADGKMERGPEGTALCLHRFGESV